MEIELLGHIFPTCSLAPTVWDPIEIPEPAPVTCLIAPTTKGPTQVLDQAGQLVSFLLTTESPFEIPGLVELLFSPTPEIPFEIPDLDEAAPSSEGPTQELDLAR
jgi:hypothetical protein